MLQIKPVFRCQEHFKPKFSSSRCLLTISVGQEVHEGAKFLATVALVDRCFDSCIMLIDDTLQRHTMALEIGAESGDEQMLASFREGDAWLTRNREAYSQMQIPLQIVRWNKWLYHKKYPYFRAMLQRIYSTDASYRNCFEKTIDQFLERYSRRSLVNYTVDIRARRLCLDYLLEECSIMCLWPELGCEFEVYPNYRNAAMDETHRRFILPNHPELLHAVCVKFKNRGQLAPQKFEFIPKIIENRSNI